VVFVAKFILQNIFKKSEAMANDCHFGVHFACLNICTYCKFLLMPLQHRYSFWCEAYEAMSYTLWCSRILEEILFLR